MIKYESNEGKGEEARMLHFDHLVLFVLIIMFQVEKSKGSDTIIPGQSLSGNSTITSKGGVFEMGLFSPSNSAKYYLGIWYKGLPMRQKTVVWVANRENPVFDPITSSLEFDKDGDLVLFSPLGHAIWSTNMSHVRFRSNGAVGVLGDDGNFMLSEISRPYGVLWQSFDHPTDTLLPSKLLGHDYPYNTPELNSWKDLDDPTPGRFFAVYNYDHDQFSGAVYKFLKNGSQEFDKSVECVSSYEELLQYELTLFRIVMHVDGQLKLFAWWKGSQQWSFISCKQNDYKYYPPCFCHEFSICNMKNPLPCHCMEGFVPDSPLWNLGIYQCKRRTSLDCINGITSDWFIVIPNIVRDADTIGHAIELIEGINSSYCRLTCLVDCLCSAYAFYDSTCFLWDGPLENFQELSSSAEIGRDLYVRVAESEIKETPIWYIVGIGLPSLILFLFVLKIVWEKLHIDSPEAMGDTLTQFKHQHLQKATKNFSEKLGEGGFSDVYKGELPNSTLVAVKQLKGHMHQDKQLRAEISTIGVIQHKNLLRLRGFCLGHSKRFLVYDYMPNGSLQSNLFKKGNSILDWTKRYNIALGIAKGLAYLHDSCRDCIIHCDIKPDNILLDADFTPKLADFGLAKLLGRNFSQVLTTMRGTRGYLAPEWFSGGAITSKVDVYSYGQVLFEIISGRRNMEMSNDELSNYFPSLVFYALNNGEEIVSLVDPKVQDDVNVEELTRACNVACWCIQDHENDRPTMSRVIQILEGTFLVGVPPIPQFFQSLAQGSLKVSDIKSSEICSTSSSMPYSFSFQPPVAVSISKYS